MNQMKTRSRKAPSPDALTISVERAGELLGISRATAYQAVTEGRIPSIRFGRKVVVPRAAIDRIVAQAGAAQP